MDVSASADNADETGPRLEQSASIRFAIYQIAFEMVGERPLLGFGPDNFAVGFPKYRTENEPDELELGITTSAHGWVSQVASGSGLLGLCSFIGIAIVGFWLTMRGGFRPAAWAGAGMLASFLAAGLTTVNAISTDWLFWGALGLIGVATTKEVSDPQISVRRRRSASGPRFHQSRPRMVIAASCVILGAGLALTATNALAASHSAKDSQVKRLAAQPQQAVDAGLKATRLDLAYVSADRTRDAIPAFEEGTRLAPYDVRYSGDLARAYIQLAQRGDVAAGARARDIADAAVRTDPNNPQSHNTRAVVMAVTGDLPEAVRSVERALALDKHFLDVGVDVAAAQIYRASGRQSDAITVARRAIGIFQAQDSLQLRIELAKALAANGQTTEALTELDALLAIKPNDPVALQLRNQIRSGNQ